MVGLGAASVGSANSSSTIFILAVAGPKWQKYKNGPGSAASLQEVIFAGYPSYESDFSYSVSFEFRD
jgi:hypothetical protein